MRLMGGKRKIAHQHVALCLSTRAFGVCWGGCHSIRECQPCLQIHELRGTQPLGQHMAGNGDRMPATEAAPPPPPALPQLTRHPRAASPSARRPRPAARRSFRHDAASAAAEADLLRPASTALSSLPGAAAAA